MNTCIIKFKKLKDIDDNKIIEDIYINMFNKIFGSDYTIIKKNTKPDNKNKIDNKMLAVLNKLTDNNIENIVIEFLKNINKINNEEYELFQKILYLKIIAEIQYVDTYLCFLLYIDKIYSNVFKYNLEYFINLVEYSFKTYYCNYIVYDKYNFINNTEEIRINNNILIKKLISNNLLKSDILDKCSDILLDTKKYYTDIYYWFNDIDINAEYIKTIKTICDKVTDLRTTILLKKLL